MSVGLRLAPSIRRFGWLALLCLCAGCGPTTPLGKAGVVLEPPANWLAVPLTKWPVPGTALAAWSGPGGSSLVVYRALPIPQGTAEGLAESLANRLENLPGLSVVSQRTESRGGALAARVEVVAPGTGDALAPSGVGVPVAPEGKTLVPTRRILLGIPRPNDTVYLVWHGPESSHQALAADAEAALRRFRIDPGRLQTDSY